MKYIIIVFLLLSSCASRQQVVPVKREFPNAPAILVEQCPDLSLVPEDTKKLSELLSVVTENYGKYHTCRFKVESWIDWYNEQKQNFESVK